MLVGAFLAGQHPAEAGPVVLGCWMSAPSMVGFNPANIGCRIHVNKYIYNKYIYIYIYIHIHIHIYIHIKYTMENMFITYGDHLVDIFPSFVVGLCDSYLPPSIVWMRPTGTS